MPWNRFGRVRWLLAGGILLFALSGCNATNKVESLASQADVGKILVTLTSITPWTEIAPALQPNFQLTGDAAVSKVLPVAARATDQILNSFGATIAGSLINKTPTSTAGSTQAGLPSTALPSLSTAADPSVDPVLVYQASKSLFEEVQILNREVVNSALAEGYTAYLVRLRVDIQSFRRNIPYDVHSQIGFFLEDPPGSDPQASGDNRASVDLPVVLPLVATADIQRSVAQQASLVARQLSASLNALFPSGTLGAGVNSQFANQSADFGNSYDSILSIGRETTNVLSIKIGAQNTGHDRPTLVEQPYNITAMVLVPKKCRVLMSTSDVRCIYSQMPNGDSNKPKSYLLRAHIASRFIDSQSGSVLPSATDKDWQNAVTSAVVEEGLAGKLNLTADRLSGLKNITLWPYRSFVAEAPKYLNNNDTRA